MTTKTKAKKFLAKMVPSVKNKVNVSISGIYAVYRFEGKMMAEKDIQLPPQAKTEYILARLGNNEDVQVLQGKLKNLEIPYELTKIPKDKKILTNKKYYKYEESTFKIKTTIISDYLDRESGKSASQKPQINDTSKKETQQTSAANKPAAPPLQKSPSTNAPQQIDEQIKNAVFGIIQLDSTKVDSKSIAAITYDTESLTITDKDSTKRIVRYFNSQAKSKNPSESLQPLIDAFSKQQAFSKVIKKPNSVSSINITGCVITLEFCYREPTQVNTATTGSQPSSIPTQKLSTNGSSSILQKLVRSTGASADKNKKNAHSQSSQPLKPNPSQQSRPQCAAKQTENAKISHNGTLSSISSSAENSLEIKRAFMDAVKDYKTSSRAYNFFVWIFPFLSSDRILSSDRSTQIVSLRALGVLAEKGKATITHDEVKKTLLKCAGGNKKDRRYLLFIDKTKDSDGTSTDEVIVTLRKNIPAA